jgi:hypothetical protein
MTQFIKIHLISDGENSHLKISAALEHSACFHYTKSMENEAEKGVNTIDMLIISF